MGNNDLLKVLMLVIVSAITIGCTEQAPYMEAIPGRWYTTATVERGRALFHTHCASCHGERAEGTAEWRKVDANGNYPPPPLNGTAHAWHHAMTVLEETIARGGVSLGGVMPGFAGTLSVRESRATIAYFQSYWPDETYARWDEIDAQ